MTTLESIVDFRTKLKQVVSSDPEIARLQNEMRVIQAHISERQAELVEVAKRMVDQERG